MSPVHTVGGIGLSVPAPATGRSCFDLRRSRRGSYSCRAYQVETSVEDVVAALAHAGLERVLELLLGAEALVGPAAESSARGPDGRAGARRSARGPDRRAGRRAEQPTDRPADRRLLGGASRGVEGQFAALGLVTGDPGGVRIVVGIHRRLVAAHGGAAGDDECKSKEGFAHVRLTPSYAGLALSDSDHCRWFTARVH